MIPYRAAALSIFLVWALVVFIFAAREDNNTDSLITAITCVVQALLVFSFAVLVIPR